MLYTASLWYNKTNKYLGGRLWLIQKYHDTF